MAQQEKKYGLIEPKKKLTVADVFKNDSDSGDDPTIKEKKSSEKGLKKQTVIDMNRALLEDPTVYQYDEVYDTMKKPESEANKSKVERKTKYMDALMKSADKRKKENERRTERLVQKEREAEGETFKDKEEFITSSYRKKLEENKIAEEEERKMEYIESVMDVTKQQDLGSFYRHLYKETVPEPEQKNGKTLAPEKTEEKVKVSSSSSESDSSSDSSSSDSSSTEEEVPKKEEIKPPNSSDEVKSKTLEDGEIPSAPEEDKSKLSEKDEKLKFGGGSRRDRSYRQRDSSYREKSERKDTHSVALKARHENTRDRDRDRDRTKERDRSSRIDQRSSSWRANERNRDERKNDTRRRSRSRSNRDRNNSRRDTSYKKDERRDRRDAEPEKKSEKRNPQKSESDQKGERLKEDRKAMSKPTNTSSLEIKENIEKSINIWNKRTVGPVFDAALERYHQRKAARKSIAV